VRSLAIALALVSACDTFVRHAPKGPPPDGAVVRSLCRSDLGGPRASLRVWRDDHGEVTLYELRSDPALRNRSWMALFDTRGREQLRQPPIEAPGSPDALEADRKRETVIEDSRLGETIKCAMDGGV
jgi:hypothetical protein